MDSPNELASPARENGEVAARSNQRGRIGIGDKIGENPEALWGSVCAIAAPIVFLISGVLTCGLVWWLRG